MTVLLWVPRAVLLLVILQLAMGIVFQLGCGFSVLLFVGAWRNRQAARRTLRLLYRVATTCPLCEHEARKTWRSIHGEETSSCAEFECNCGYHGRSAVLPQPPAPECWQ